MKHIKRFDELNESLISKVNDVIIDDILYFKYQNMKHIYSDKSQSDKYTLEVTNFENSFYNKNDNGNITSIFLTSNNILKDELEWYEDNTELEFLNGYNYDSILNLGNGVELVTFIGNDDINIYFNKFKNKFDYIWGQYFTDSEKVDISKAIARTKYNNREIIIVIKNQF
jgi:hypothetical protein